ncbi:dienelactone hydrolase-like enzyme [Opitutaceae bacterium TAV1]|nr:dienelactone hydrolase-like enzyme [Opitutaceae bacterium TAV1]
MQSVVKKTMRPLFPFFSLIFTLAAAPFLHAGSWTTTIKPKRDDNFNTASFRLWIDDAQGSGSIIKPVRGLLVVAPGWNGDGARLADDGHWQALARELSFGIVAVTFKSDDDTSRKPPYHAAHLGSGAAFLRALRTLASDSRHPEVADAPWLAWGHSAGGQLAYGLACVRPDRTLAFAAIKGGYYETEFDKRARAVPGLWVVGERDEPFRAQAITDLFEEHRKNGALWCVAWEKNSGHEEGRSRESVLPFFREAVALRLPATGRTVQPLTVSKTAGWLGIRASYAITPAAKPPVPVPATVRTVWLPGEASARAWVKLGGGVDNLDGN